MSQETDDLLKDAQSLHKKIWNRATIVCTDEYSVSSLAALFVRIVENQARIEAKIEGLSPKP